MSRKGSFLHNMRDKLPPAAPPVPGILNSAERAVTVSARAPSREGRKQIAGFFSNEMSLAMRTTAMRHNMTLQQAMAEAFDDWLRKYGESPLGD